MFSMKTIRFETSTATIAAAMGLDLAAFNAGVYEGTKIRVRQLSGSERVLVTGTTAGAKIVTDETWIADRFGCLGARQIRRLVTLVA
jgi:hypothetical protein